jgi:hypothetical protein
MLQWGVDVGNEAHHKCCKGGGHPKLFAGLAAGRSQSAANND